jgi:hypothetical protein
MLFNAIYIKRYILDDIYGILNRLKSLYGVTKRTELCEKMGIGLGTYDTWRSNKRIPEKRLKQIAEANQVHYKWLLSGEGPRLITQEPLILTPDIREAIKAHIQPHEAAPECHKICSAFSVIDKDKQEEALREVLALIAKYY